MLFTDVLNKNKDFLLLYKKGKAIGTSSVVVYFRPNRMPVNRLGITTGKKIGGAVSRVRARRVIKAAYRNAERFFPIGFDIVIVARDAAVHSKSTEIEGFLKSRVVKEMNKPFDFKQNNFKRKSKK